MRVRAFVERLDFLRAFVGIIKQVQDSKGQYILFIDELHLLSGAGKTDGAMDASNLLKPALGTRDARFVNIDFLATNMHVLTRSRKNSTRRIAMHWRYDAGRISTIHRERCKFLAFRSDSRVVALNWFLCVRALWNDDFRKLR